MLRACLLLIVLYCTCIFAQTIEITHASAPNYIGLSAPSGQEPCWDYAQDYCQSQYSTSLATIRTPSDQSEIEALVQQMNVNNGGGQDGSKAWIGFANADSSTKNIAWAPCARGTYEECTYNPCQANTYYMDTSFHEKEGSYDRPRCGEVQRGNGDTTLGKWSFHSCCSTYGGDNAKDFICNAPNGKYGTDIICYPTSSPTPSPTNNPTPAPTLNPTISPTPSPTTYPTSAPSTSPTSSPSRSPFVPGEPTQYPTDPSITPTINPTINPTKYPTNNPTLLPTNQPTYNPTLSPTYATFQPTFKPTLLIPSSTLSPTDNDNEVTEAINTQRTEDNLNEAAEKGSNSFLDKYLLYIIISGVLFIILLFICIILFKRKKSKQLKNEYNNNINNVVSDTEMVTTQGATSTHSKINGEAINIKKENVIKSDESDSEIFVMAGNGNELINILKENGLYDALYKILYKNGMDLNTLEHLKKDEIDSFCEEIKLNITQKLQFRKLMSIIEQKPTQEGNNETNQYEEDEFEEDEDDDDMYGHNETNKTTSGGI